MDSTAGTMSPPLHRPAPPRRPLQPHNRISAVSPSFKKKLALTTPAKGSAVHGKENAPALTEVEEMVSADVSLGEELGAARMRRDRLKQERERTEEILRAVERALHRGLREMERRAEEQRLVDLAIRWMVGMRGFSESPLAMPSTPVFQSLREREHERRTMEEMSKGMITSDKEEVAKGWTRGELSEGSDKHLDIEALDTRTEHMDYKGNTLLESSDTDTHTEEDKQEIQNREASTRN